MALCLVWLLSGSSVLSGFVGTGETGLSLCRWLGGGAWPSGKRRVVLGRGWCQVASFLSSSLDLVPLKALLVCPPPPFPSPAFPFPSLGCCHLHWCLPALLFARGQPAGGAFTQHHMQGLLAAWGAVGEAQGYTGHPLVSSASCPLCCTPSGVCPLGGGALWASAEGAARGGLSWGALLSVGSTLSVGAFLVSLWLGRRAVPNPDVLLLSWPSTGEVSVGI